MVMDSNQNVYSIISTNQEYIYLRKIQDDTTETARMDKNDFLPAVVIKHPHNKYEYKNIQKNSFMYI